MFLGLLGLFMMIWIDIWDLCVVFVMLLYNYMFKCRFEFVFVAKWKKGEIWGEIGIKFEGF